MRLPQIRLKAPQAPAVFRLSEEARRFGEAAEIFGPQGFFGPEASRLTYGIETPTDQVPAIRFPTAFLERCKEFGAQLRLHPNRTPEGEPLTMPAMDRLTFEWRCRESKGKLLYNASGWKADEPFFRKEDLRPGWRVVFSNIVAGTTSRDDLAQTELLIAKIIALFKGRQMPGIYKNAIAEFEARKANIRILMEGDNTRWPMASEAIQDLALSRRARPIPLEVLDIMAVNLKCGNQNPYPFQNIFTRTPRCSSDGHLVCIGHFGPEGGFVENSRPRLADSLIGASLSLQSW